MAAQSTVKVNVTPTVTAGTYAASKVIGGVMTFANILPPITPYAGIIQSISLRFKGSLQTVGFSVALFSASPTGTFTDTTTAAIASGDTALLLGIFTLSTASSVLGTHTVYSLDGIGKAINGASSSLYAVVLPNATTAALASTSDMTLSISVIGG